MKRVMGVLAALVALGGLGFWIVTSPALFTALRGSLPVPNRAGDPDKGLVLFHAGGCASCHASPGQNDKAKLGGGLALATPFGTFHAPNISSDVRDGIGGWSEADFIRAMHDGVSPDGQHYYPAFPYTSYRLMPADDLADLFAYLKTMPAVQGRAPAHDLPFPFSVRRGLGLWKLAFLMGGPYQSDPAHDAQWNRGAYLVRGPGHCGECHTPRNLAGAMEIGRFGAGAPDPEGKGWVPNITSDKSGLAAWSQNDIKDLLTTGFTPDYDAVGGSMAQVVRNTAQLSDDDRAAMAIFIKTLPPMESKRPPRSPN